MIFADMFSPSDTRFSPSCDPPDGTFSPNLSDLRDEGQLNENRLARVPAINSLHALLREAAAGLVDIHRVYKCVNFYNLLLRIQEVRDHLRCDLLTRDVVLGFNTIHLLLVKAARLVCLSYATS